ncbi:MAG TPA: ATP-binding protein, partial [Kribbella sp.]
MTDEPTEIDANQSADPIGTVAAVSADILATSDVIPSNVVERAYDASAIQVLEGLDAVRKRPGMYIGSTGERGLHHLVTEVVDNAVDEAMAGYGDRIVVTLLPDGGVRVEDNGRGIPVDIVESEGKPAVTVVLTVLHAGGKFGGGGYKVSGGLHGVGVSVVNALSTKLRVDVKLNGKLYTQSFTHGVPDEDLAEIGTSESNGTTVTFWADQDVFETTTYSYETLATRFREMAFLNKGLEIVIRDERPDHTEDGHPVEQAFKADNGLVDYVKYLTGIRETVHRDVISFEAASNGENSMSLEVALQWSGSFQESVHTFANAINTHEGGTHEEGFRAALTSLVNSFGEDQGMIKKKEDRVSGDDVREGLTAIVSIKLNEPQFEGQTKT